MGRDSPTSPPPLQMVLSGADVPPHLLLSWTILSWAPEASGPPTLPSSGQPGDRARYDQLRGPNSSLRPTRFRPLSCGLGPVGPSVALGSGHVPLRRLTRLSPTAPSDPSLLGGGSLPGWPVPVPSMKGLVLFLCLQPHTDPELQWGPWTHSCEAGPFLRRPQFHLCVEGIGSEGKKMELCDFGQVP